MRNLLLLMPGKNLSWEKIQDGGIQDGRPLSFTTSGAGHLYTGR